MPTHAGDMQTGTPPNPQWVPANGAPYYINNPNRYQRTPDVPPSTGNRLDYIRRTGWQGRRRGLGPLGWIICVPYDPIGAYYVSLADDGTETTLTNPPTVAHPPPGVT